jgi:hypothetical protein
MRVKTYHEQGLKHRVEMPPEGYESLGAAEEKGHRVAFFGRVEEGHLKDVVYTSSKRCKKLMALADVVADRLKGQPRQGFRVDPEEVLGVFQEERDREKMGARMALILRALELSGP